jgi:hypothetical protein
MDDRHNGERNLNVDVCQCIEIVQGGLFLGEWEKGIIVSEHPVCEQVRPGRNLGNHNLESAEFIEEGECDQRHGDQGRKPSKLWLSIRRSPLWRRSGKTAQNST